MAYREDDPSIVDKPMTELARFQMAQRHSCDWTRYRDGQTWILRQGEDFMHTSPSRAIGAAKRWGKKNACHVIAEPMSDYRIRVRFTFDMALLTSETPLPKVKK